MKLEKYCFVLIILCLLCFPQNVFSKEPITSIIDCSTENISISVCDSEECDFYDLEEAYIELDNYNNSCDIYNLTINIGEGYYDVEDFDFRYINTLKIKGQSKKDTIIKTNGHVDFYEVNNVYISNLTIKGDTYSSVLEIFESRNVFLDNLLVDAKNSQVGIEFYYDDNVEVNEVEIRGAQAFGIYNNQCSLPPVSGEFSEPTAAGMAPYRNILNINNSDISNNACGVLDGCYPNMYPKSGEKSFEPTTNNGMLTYDYDTTIVESSKIACAVAYGGYYHNSPPSIYIKSNNNWIEKPVYNENVIETHGGRVIIDLEEDRTVSISNKDNLVIESIFDDASDVDWEIENEEIAKVENGKIVPLKVGSTFLIATDGRTNYRINLVVTNDLLNNPNTLSIGYVLIIVLVFGILGSVVYKKQKSN